MDGVSAHPSGNRKVSERLVGKRTRVLATSSRRCELVLNIEFCTGGTSFISATRRNVHATTRALPRAPLTNGKAKAEQEYEYIAEDGVRRKGTASGTGNYKDRRLRV